MYVCVCLHVHPQRAKGGRRLDGLCGGAWALFFVCCLLLHIDSETSFFSLLLFYHHPISSPSTHTLVHAHPKGTKKRSRQPSTLWSRKGRQKGSVRRFLFLPVRSNSPVLSILCPSFCLSLPLSLLFCFHSSLVKPTPLPLPSVRLIAQLPELPYRM